MHMAYWHWQVKTKTLAHIFLSHIFSTIDVSDRLCTWLIGIGKLKMHSVDKITFLSHVNHLETHIPYIGNRNTSRTQF